ncbi:IMPACT family protein [Rhodococcus sp. WMMA185]|uniref:IMPACT family protein n=1 Tax=Rhodococcus sp. WMMA185 TaxID=679318 RepID=UPI0008785B8B|nr:YigZ family protein [Rhodococcus sp. WMMA185]AOW91813.1 IMPACT family protein [Rhodococcus sp. WMMA185]
MPFTLAPRATTVSVETEVKHSRFIAAVRRVEDSGAAHGFVQEQRRAYSDARHHCSAYIVGDGPSDRVERANDDGEPGGTAGVPMLQVLRARELVDVVVVVTRYFGGIKLGAGGLVRAYSGAVSAALDIAPLVRRERRHLYTLAVEHSEAGRVEAELRARGVGVVHTTYGERAVLTLVAHDSTELAEMVAAATSGAGTLDPAGEMWVDA